MSGNNNDTNIVGLKILNTYDLSGIGLDFKITPETYIDDLMDKMPYHSIQTIKINMEKIEFTKTKTEYTLGNCIAKGNYGSVYAATNNEGKLFAIKIQLVDNSIRRGENKEEREEEIREEKHNVIKEAIVSYIINENDKDNTPAIYNFGFLRDGNITKYYSVIEYLLGKTIAKFMSEQGGICDKLDKLCPIINSTAKIIKGLHEKDIEFTHGDLHAGNVMINGDKIKIIDFGMCRIKLGNHPIICNSDFNNIYNKGKDLIIFITGCVWRTCGSTKEQLLQEFNEIFSANDLKLQKTKLNEMSKTLPPDTLYVLDGETFKVVDNLIVEKLNKIINMVKEFYNMDRGFMYEKLDNNDITLGNPDDIIEQTKDCTQFGGRLKLKGGYNTSHGRTRRRAILPSSVLSRRIHKSSTRKQKNMNPIIKSLRSETSPEFKIHENRETYGNIRIGQILSKSTNQHISSYAVLIADTYMSEKDESMQLDLFRTLLFFDSSVSPGAFESFCKEYNATKSLKSRQFMLYGTDSDIRGERFMHIHWNAIGDWLK